MSDLQCPATLLLVDTDHAAPEGGLRGALEGRQVSAVYADGAAVHAAAQTLASDLGASCSRLPRDSGPRALEELSDLHRGETVVVVATGDLLRLVSGPEARSQPVELLIDADGWLVR